MSVERDSQYKSLMRVLDQAFSRASEGKGKIRHATDEPFEHQQLCRDLKALGISPALYQIRKKALEASRLPYQQTRNELLDIIVYAAAAIIACDRHISQTAERASLKDENIALFNLDTGEVHTGDKYESETSESELP